MTHEEGFKHARVFLSNQSALARTSSDPGVRSGFALCVSILNRPRCKSCTYELSASAGLCWRCGTSQKELS